MRIQIELPYWLKDVTKIHPIRWYGYTTIVRTNIFWLSDANSQQIPQELRDLFNAVLDKACAMSDKVRCYENKVAIECRIDGFPHNVFFGVKDAAVTIGLTVEADSHIVPIELAPQPEIQLYEFEWSKDYGAGVLIIAATSQTEANKLAKIESGHWKPNGFATSDLKFNGDVKECPLIVLENLYVE